MFASRPYTKQTNEARIQNVCRFGKSQLLGSGITSAVLPCEITFFVTHLFLVSSLPSVLIRLAQI